MDSCPNGNLEEPEAEDRSETKLTRDRTPTEIEAIIQKSGFETPTKTTTTTTGLKAATVTTSVDATIRSE